MRRALILLASATLACSPPSQAPTALPSPTAATPRVDPVALRAVEERTEALSQRIAAMCDAARAGDATGVAAALAPEVALGLPAPADTTRAERDGIARRDWSIPPPASKQAAAAAQAMIDWLGAFPTTEDFRIRLASSALTQEEDGSSLLEGTFGLQVIGRNAAGEREWLRGPGRWAARAGADGDWRLTKLAADAAFSLLAERDLVTDVSGSAGIRRPDPALLERGGRGLVSHGAAAADVDGDGLVDVFATGLGRHSLFRNRGDGTFEDVAADAGIATTSSPAGGPLFLDADGDGDQDLFISGVGRQTLLENRLVPDGALRFRDVSGAAGVEVERSAFSAAAGDVNGDGREDIVVAAYGDYGNVVPDSWHAAANGQPNLLFLNEGGLRFREAAADLGCADPRWSYAALVADVDDDADLDVVFANDFGGAVGLYLNDGGRFRDAAAERGLGAPAYGMGLALGDVDRDGDLDLHVTKMSSVEGRRILDRIPEADLPQKKLLQGLASGNGLYRNLGAGRFEDVSATAGPFRGGWAWGGGFVDLDADGWPDLVVPNGFLSGTGPGDTGSLFWRQVVASVQGGQPALEFLGEQAGEILERGASFSGRERDSVHLNRGDGSFLDVSGCSGLDSMTDGRAAVFADFDNDGDADVFLRAMHSEAHLLFRNDAPPRGTGFVRVALRGTRSSPDAHGAIVRVRVGERVTAQAKLGGEGFLSQSDPRLLFGLGAAPRCDAIDVAWPSGLRQSFPGVAAGSSLLLVEGEADARPVKERRFRLGGR